LTLGFGVWGLGFGVWGLGLRVQEFGGRVQSLGLGGYRRVKDSGIRVSG
jgi:hypothetical protein